MECDYLLDLWLYQECSVCDYVSVEFSLKFRGKNNRCDGSVPVVICPSDFPFKREEKGALFFLNVFLLSFFFVSNGRSMICIGLVLWINCNSRGRQNIAASPASLLLKSTPQASSPPPYSPLSNYNCQPFIRINWFLFRFDCCLIFF